MITETKTTHHFLEWKYEDFWGGGNKSVRGICKQVPNTFAFYHITSQRSHSTSVDSVVSVVKIVVVQFLNFDLSLNEIQWYFQMGMKV